MIKIKYILTILLTALLGGGVLYAADKELVDILVNKGYLSKEEAHKIMSDVSHGPIIKTKGKLVKKLTFSGRVHGQWDYLSADIDGQEDGQDDPSTENSFIMRRLYFGVKADLGEGWEGVVNASFGDDTNRLDKGYLAKKLSDDFKVYAGYLKAPFGIEETTSSSKIKSVERSALNRFFIEDLNFGARVTGVQLHGSMSGLKGVLAVTNIRQGNFDNGSDSKNDDGVKSKESSFAYWGRLNHTLFLNTEESAKLMLGGDVAFLPTDAALQYDRELKNRDALVYTVYGKLSVDDFLSIGDASILLQLMGADVEDKSPIGFNIMPSIFLTNDFELVLSYSFLDSDGMGIDPSDATRHVNDNGGYWDEYNEFYVGINYFISGNDLKFSAGYVYAKGADFLTGDHGTEVADEDNAFTSNGFRARLQLLF
jgi:phosphate-selective porin